MLKIEIISVGTSYPAWLAEGFNEYEKRMKSKCNLVVREIDSVKKSRKLNAEEKKMAEGKSIIALLDRSSRIISLDQSGKHWTSEKLAENLNEWTHLASRFQFLIGGSEGLFKEIIDLSDNVFSLSKLTLPHALARLVLFEQLYRALMINSKHPYHR